MTDDCKIIRKDILSIAHTSRHGHVPTCFSIVELLVALYRHMNHDPADPMRQDRDIFVLSKGHAALAHYLVLAHNGYFPAKEVANFGSYDSMFGCHADRSKIPGVEVSTGSLGHGIAVAVGIALSFKIKQEERSVYTLIGDGESNEGSVWESILVAESLNLNNLTIIYDNNKSHARGLQIKNPCEKFTSFGCDVLEVDGHDEKEILTALQASCSKPKAIVANTIKGYGCGTLINDQYAWHRRSPNATELNTLLEELNASPI